MPDTHDKWIAFLLYWIKLYDRKVMDTIILEEGIYELHIKNEIIFLFGMDLSAGTAGQGCIKGGNYFVAILHVNKADKGKEVNNWDGDLVELELTDGSNRREFEKLFRKNRKMSYRRYKELKDSSHKFKYTKYLIYPIPPGY
eukprot:452043_1